MQGKKLANPNEKFEVILARMWLVRVLSKVQFASVVICWAAIAFAVWLKFSGGNSEAITVIAGFGGSLGILSYLIGRYIEKWRREFEELQRDVGEIDRREKEKSRLASATKKIPLAVGFANLIGERMASTVSEDVGEISSLFLKSVVPPPHQIPQAEVLFVYADLAEDGTIGPAGKSGIRQIVQLTNAAIVVVASPNSSSAIGKAIELPGPKSANLIFTLNRSDREFGRFFQSLFEKMRDGSEMLGAWVELNPQSPVGSSGHPETLLIAEAGKIAFPSGSGTHAPVAGQPPQRAAS